MANWWAISTLYTDGSDRRVSSQVSMGKEIQSPSLSSVPQLTYNSSRGVYNLNDNGLQSLIKSQLNSGTWSPDGATIYLVLTSSAVFLVRTGPNLSQ